MYFNKIYNFRSNDFSNFLVFFEMNVKNHNFYEVLKVLTMKTKFAPIHTMIFVITTSKYVSILSFKKIGWLGFSKLTLFIFRGILSSSAVRFKGSDLRSDRNRNWTLRVNWKQIIHESCVVVAYCNRACAVQMYKALSVRY